MNRSRGWPRKLRLVAHSTEAVDPLGMAAPHQMGDRAAHRVADSHERVDVQHAGERGHVIGAVLEPETAAGPDAAAVAPVIESDDAEVLAQGS